MYSQLPLDFSDGDSGEDRKEKGSALAAVANRKLLDQARQIALSLGRKYTTTDADYVLKAMEKLGIDLSTETSPNWRGSIFRTKDWQAHGFRKSSRKSRHAGMIRVWKLRSDDDSSSNQGSELESKCE